MQHLSDHHHRHFLFLSMEGGSPGHRVTPCALVDIFVYNPTLARDETDEHKKIIAYYPNTIPLETQKFRIGLIQGLVAFCSTFRPSNPCRFVEFENQVSVILNPDRNLWFVLSVSTPFVELSTTSLSKTAIRTKKYLDLDMDVLSTLLMRVYEMFVFFHGPMQRDGSKLDALKACLSDFLSKYVPFIRFSQFPYFVNIEGLPFLSCDRSTFLRVQSFINHTHVKFSNLVSSAALFRHKVIHRGSELSDLDIKIFCHLEQDFMRPFLESIKLDDCKQDFTSLVRVNSSTGSRIILKPIDTHALSRGAPRKHNKGQ